MTTLNNVNTNKSLTQVLEEVTTAIKMSLNCVKIGEIVSFDKTDQTASVKVLHVIDENYHVEMETGKQVEYPVIGKVPVVIMGGGTTYISHPISPGDQCLLLFCDYMIDSWWVSGKAEPSIVPRKHDISDPIAIVGVNATPNAIKEYSDYLRLHYNKNSSIVIGEQIDVNNETINLNGNTTNTGTMTVKDDTTLEKKLTVQEDVTMNANANVVNTLTAKSLNATTAATGTFVSADNKSVTVVNGIVTSIA